MHPKEALRIWRSFATSTEVTFNEKTLSWADYIEKYSRADEESLIQPHVFPRFASSLLGFKINQNLAPEKSGKEGKPDFTPADATTHPFVFETKSTAAGVALNTGQEQITRYLKEGRPRIKKVVLTNLAGLRIFELDSSAKLSECSNINLRGLLRGDLDVASKLSDVARLAAFIEEFSFKELSLEQKVERIRESQPWNPVVEATDSAWVSARLDAVVRLLNEDVRSAVSDGILSDSSHVMPSEREAILDELKSLELRLGASSEAAEQRALQDFVSAKTGTSSHKAIEQYIAHVAYYTATRLFLVRIWEDFGLLESVLYDGGFNNWMERFDDVISEVIEHSFSRARRKYRSLFVQTNTYTWYQPSDNMYAHVIYELGNTYLGDIQSDVLGEVYERLLERIDRKMLGQYYTPRDVIELMWDLIDIDEVAKEAEHNGRLPTVLDIATGSGGFLVEGARRLRNRFEKQLDAGSDLNPQQWVDELSRSLNGIEIQRFPAYLAELNILIQVGKVMKLDPTVRIPPLGIIPGDSLSLHNQSYLWEDVLYVDESEHPSVIVFDANRRERAELIKRGPQGSLVFDVACGNPPYIGQKTAAKLMRWTREQFPYWETFVGPHQDYLYWFLILGVSKLRREGRFSFITTEYWLRTAGARPLRAYLAERCDIDRLILFRDMRLFPDAPGQHSLVISGTRKVPPDGAAWTEAPEGQRPIVVRYEGAGSQTPAERAEVLQRMGSGERSWGPLRIHKAPISPNELGGNSWADVLKTSSQLIARRRARSAEQIGKLDIEKGTEPTINALPNDADQFMPAATLRELNWPEQKTGVFVLSAAEVAALEISTDYEQKSIKRICNTRDVYFYACVPREEGNSLIYLPASLAEPEENIDPVELPFPGGFPSLQSYLEKFAPILRHKVRDRGEARPWWSLHRARERIIGDATSDDDWAPFCVTPTRSPGAHIRVGMVPAGCVPASGLHAMRFENDSEIDFPSCGFINALFGSSLFQALAEDIPPGYVQAELIKEFGMPEIGTSAAHRVAELGVTLAASVTNMIQTFSLSFPGLAEALKVSPEIKLNVTECWLPRADSSTGRGKLRSLKWVGDIAKKGSMHQKVAEVEVGHDLFGLRVAVLGKNGALVRISVADSSEEKSAVLLSLAKGIEAGGGKLSDFLDARLPVDAGAAISEAQGDRENVMAEINQYHLYREEVDSIITDTIGG